MSKIHFIPSEHHPGTQTIPVEGTLPDGMRPYLFVKIEPKVITSPFAEVMYLFGASWNNQEMLTEHAIWMRFWDRIDLIDWIENNCRSHVVVQPMTMGGQDQGWRFGFVDPRDHNRFRAFVYGGALMGVFTLNVTEAVYNEIAEWVRNNVSGDAEVRRVGYGTSMGKVKMVVRIKDLTSAAAFKIVWHGEGEDAA
jgi:hypothetical protein